MGILSDSLIKRISDVRNKYHRAVNFLKENESRKESLRREVVDTKAAIDEQEAKHKDSVYRFLKNDGDESKIKESMENYLDNKIKLAERETALKHSCDFIESEARDSQKALAAYRDEFRNLTSEAWEKLFMEELPNFQEAFLRIYRLYLRAEKITGASMHVPSPFGFIATYQERFIDKRLLVDAGIETERKNADQIFINHFGIEPGL